MIKKQNDISQKPKTEPYYEITASLLNSWQRIWDAKDWVRESESDEISIEDKISQAMEKANQEFLNSLNRIPFPDNEAMAKGRQYESDVYDGKDDIFSPVVENGEFQAAYTKKIKINGMNIMLYGILDCLKAGRIYDIKRVGHYQTAKYKKSHQHPMYFALVPEALDFTYLVCDDRGDHHFERYLRENCEDIEDVVRTFLMYLEANGLMETFKTKWDWDRKKHIVR